MAGGPTSEHRERELKFDVAQGWQLPDVAALASPGGSIERATVHLESSYHDTVDRDLLRARITMRRRTGDTDTGWHLKIPAGDARLELRLPLDGGADVPAELLRLTTGVTGGAAPAPIATLRTRRDVHRLLDDRGRPLAEIVVDDVRATLVGATAPADSWREVEVELAEGDEALLARIAERLEESGARPSVSTSKLARALGRPVADLPARAGLAALVADYLDAQYAQLVAGDVALRRGQDVVHQTRVATRRYRSVLRIFADVIDAERSAALDAELAWYAAALGALRDVQVLRAHLDDAVAQLPPELVLGPVTARMHQLLEADRLAAQAALDDVLAGERYIALLRQLRAWHEDTPLGDGAAAADAGRYLARADKKARRRLRKAERAGTDAAMHRARKAAKRLRYTAEVTEPALGGPARKARTRAKKIQAGLGRRQDSVLAAGFLLRAGRVAGTSPGENGFTFGLLYQCEPAVADARSARHRT